MDEEKMYTYEFIYEVYKPADDGRISSYITMTEHTTKCGISFDDAVITFNEWLNENKMHVLGFVEARMVYNEADAAEYGERYASTTKTEKRMFRLYDEWDVEHASKIIAGFCKQRRSCKGCVLSRNDGSHLDCMCGTSPCEWYGFDEEEQI
jgi:hypothetical protein